MHEPAEGALDGPPLGDHGEARDAGGALDHVDVDAQAGAVVDGLSAVAGVDPRLAHPAMGGGDAGQQLQAGGASGDAGCGYPDGWQQAERVASQVAPLTSMMRLAA